MFPEEMALALVNSAGPAQPKPEGLLDLGPSGPAYPSYGWLGPRISFSQEFPDDDDQPPSAVKSQPSTVTMAGDVDLVGDFEFRQVDDPVAMLPADELFSDGKLVPLHLAPPPHPRRPPPDAADAVSPAAEILSPEPQDKAEEAASKSDPYAAFSPKAPSCTSRWRELLRLKRAAQGSGGPKSSRNCSSSAVPGGSNGAAARSLKHLLERNPKLLSSSVDASPPETEPASVPSRASLSSSSSSAPDNRDYTRLSVSTRPYQAAARGRVGRNPARRAAGEVPTRSASVDSPRMNPSGRVVFQGLGRSASSPSAIGDGGHRGRQHHHHHRGAERRCPANAVRVTPVLNVPVFGFGQLFSAPQKRDPAAGTRGGGGRSGRTERA